MTLPPAPRQTRRTYVLHRGRTLSYFGGCDYFRLSSHPRVLKALTAGLKHHGLGVSASRLTTGNHPIYEQLEQSLARFFGTESATLASNGYAPNLMAAQALAGRFSHALIDERAHGSLVDAAQFLDCPVLKFKHRDDADLARLVCRLGNIRPLVLTDGMFAHDGGVAPLKRYLAELPAGAMVLVDDAHGAGVLGKNGRGTLEHEGVSSRQIIQTITLSKAFGVYGGAVLGRGELRSQIIKGSRLFIGSTPLPLPLACAAMKSLAVLRGGRRFRARLFRNVVYVRGKLRAGGFAIEETPGPIISAVPQSVKDANHLKPRLLAGGIYPPFIQYPGGPEGGHFRFVISSEHSQRQLDGLAKVLISFASCFERTR